MRFVDTSFWIALQSRGDQHHQEARLLWTNRTEAPLTTDHVLGETWTFLRRRAGHQAAQAFVRAARDSNRLTVVHVDDILDGDAWEWLSRHDERAYSFVDATSFAVMRQLRLVEALAFDGDFTAAGFVELRP